MALKFVTLLTASVCFALQSQAASIRNPGQETISAFYVRDGNSGKLRFLGAALGTDQINQIITNKQDWLEQMRPTVTTSTDNEAGVKPIIINTGGSGSIVGGPGALNTPIFSVSPAGDVLPQPVAQAHLGPLRPNSRRPVRRGVKRNGNTKTQIYVIRPKA